MLKEFKPDVAHLHNIYHHLSPSIIGVLKKNNIPSVMTLHDYQLISPNYSLFANGKIWEGCKGGKYWRCFADRCVKNSYWKSFLATLEAYFSAWLKFYQPIDLFISPSHFLINKFKEFGFKREIVYLPSPISLPEILVKPVSSNYILYYGRLSEEKGVADLIVAYAQIKTDLLLKIVGSGPEEKNLKKLVQAEGIVGVEFLGYKQDEELWNLVSGAELVVVPSKWYENAPYTVIEAMALKKNVLASRLGGFIELIQNGENGWLFEAGNIKGLAEKMEDILSHEELQEAIGERAKASVAGRNEENYYKSLLELYKKAKHNQAF